MEDGKKGTERTHVVALFPGPASSKPKTDECRPRAALEEQNREDDTKRDTKAGADEHGREAAVPLSRLVSTCVHALIKPHHWNLE